MFSPSYIPSKPYRTKPRVEQAQAKEEWEQKLKCQCESGLPIIARIPKRPELGRFRFNRGEWLGFCKKCKPK
jgi:hypothetical protein